ncbi:MAG: cupredoxin domain-containing protein [Acidimicrobiia bacterium]
MTRRTLFAALAFMSLAVSSCTSNGDATTTVEVVSTDKECRVAATQAPVGTITFDVRNDGNDVTEFYLYDEDGAKVVGEVENIGPGVTRSMVVEAVVGSYETACKPGMAGDGIRAAFEVVDTG